jgi:hypothetical protein
MSFRQPMMKAWNEGWRPSKKEIEDVRLSLRKEPFFYNKNII